MNYVFHLIVMLAIYFILVSSTNLLVGMTNLLSMGQAAFYGISAYLSVLALNVLHLPLIVSLVFVMFLTGVFSLFVSLPARGLKGDYFILATLGFQLIVYTVLYNWVPVTRGPYGIPGIQSPKFLGLVEISGLFPYVVFSLMLGFITWFCINRLIKSPFGRNLKGIRDNELSLKSLGRNTDRIKIEVFFISSLFIALAGFLYATYISYIDPTSFNLDESIFILTALMIGGTGGIKGSVYGALFVILLPELLRFVGLPDSIAANLRQIIYGLAIIILMRFFPKGLAGEQELK